MEERVHLSALFDVGGGRVFGAELLRVLFAPDGAGEDHQRGETEENQGQLPAGGESDDEGEEQRAEGVENGAEGLSGQSLQRRGVGGETSDQRAQVVLVQVEPADLLLEHAAERHPSHPNSQLFARLAQGTGRDQLAEGAAHADEEDGERVRADLLLLLLRVGLGQGTEHFREDQRERLNERTDRCGREARVAVVLPASQHRRSARRSLRSAGRPIPARSVGPLSR